MQEKKNKTYLGVLITGIILWVVCLSAFIIVIMQTNYEQYQALLIILLIGFIIGAVMAAFVLLRFIFNYLKKYNQHELEKEKEAEKNNTAEQMDIDELVDKLSKMGDKK